MRLKHLFLPHPDTHQKSLLLSWPALLTYILIFLLLQVSFQLLNKFSPGVLGISSEITVSQVIAETNKERQKLGLSPLKENSSLDKAALAKSQNMFGENYWAHFSPSGKDPWSFIKASGYHFSYAGENLAKNFYTPSEVVAAWMASSSHRENILNPHYQEIGIAVSEGFLNGQRTVLIVQMFGSPSTALALEPQKENMSNISEKILPRINKSSAEVAGSKEISLDPNVVNRSLALFFIFMIGVLLSLDLVVLKRRGVFRFSSHHFAHLSFLAITGTMVLTKTAGEII